MSTFDVDKSFGSSHIVARRRKAKGRAKLSGSNSVKSLKKRPKFGDRLPATHPSPSTLDLLMNRRSVVAANLTEPGPSADELQLILTAGARVPDHGKLAPWRFLVFEGEARAAFGQACAAILSDEEPDASDARVESERQRFLRAPVVIGVVSKVLENHKIPVWEQHLSAGAVCQNILLAANALGYAGQWLTEWLAYDQKVHDVLGLGEEERVAGFIYLGSAKEDPMERKRPDIGTQIKYWEPS